MLLRHKKYIISFILSILPFFSFAQNGGVNGFIYDATSGEPIAYAMVRLTGTNFGEVTEKSGAYIITKVPSGKYEIEVSYLGFQTIRDSIEIANMVVNRNFTMSPDNVMLEGINVNAESQRVITETRTSVISVSTKDIKQMPSIGGTPDFAQYLQVLPGVVSTGDQGGQLYIRGGTPIQNMLLLDGMLIYNPFHSIGLFSVFDSDIIGSAEVYTGGFGAEFGGRISSVMDIRTRDGNRKHITGKVDLNTFGAKLLLEGPFIKMKENSAFSLGYILSVKGSYLKYSSKAFYPYVTDGLPYNYLDIYGKISLTGKSGSKLNLFGFRFDDKVDYTKIATYKWTNYGVGCNFLIVPGRAPMLIEGTIGYTNYYTALDDQDNKPTTLSQNTSAKDTNTRQSALNGFVANLKFTYYFGKSQLSLGAEFSGNTVRYVFFETPSATSRKSVVDYTSDVGLFVKYKYNWRDKILIEPSFRFQYYASLGKSSPEPRLSFKYNITPKVRLKLAAGMFSQNLVAATSDRDVVNLFTGFLSSPLQIPDTLPNGKEIESSMQKSQHVILGLELDVIPFTTINIEGYYKNFSVLTSINRYKMFKEDLDYMFETGKAYGGDITVEFSYKGLDIRLVYALGWVKRNDGRMVYEPHFDRRHNINFLASYSFGKRKSWQIDVRWNFGTGFPYTQTQAYFPNMDITSYDVNYLSNNEGLDFILADYNQGRLPHYHRLDISIKKSFHIGERHVIELSAGATNLYNYKNVFYKDRITNKTIYQLPLLYSVGFSWQF